MRASCDVSRRGRPVVQRGLIAPPAVALAMTGASSPGTAELRETHISLVVLFGDRVYKLKKPVRLNFVDLTTREARERICHREVELNRRIAPDVYLGVADVTGPDGEICDHLVVMRRMPDDRKLSTLVRERSVRRGPCPRDRAAGRVLSLAGGEVTGDRTGGPRRSCPDEVGGHVRHRPALCRHGADRGYRGAGA